MYNELPQAILELLYGLKFGFSPFIFIAIVISSAKAVGIKLARGFLARWILTSKSPQALIEFVKANGNKPWFHGKLAREILLITPGLADALNAILSLEGKLLTDSANLPFAEENRGAILDILHFQLVVQQTQAILEDGIVCEAFREHMLSTQNGHVSELIRKTLGEFLASRFDSPQAYVAFAKNNGSCVPFLMETLLMTPGRESLVSAMFGILEVEGKQITDYADAPYAPENRNAILEILHDQLVLQQKQTILFRGDLQVQNGHVSELIREALVTSRG